MKLLLLLDKKPGHAHQTEGVAKVLGRMTRVDILRLPVRSRLFAHNDILLFIMRHLANDPAYWLRALYGIDSATIGPVDAIIGSGRPTIAAGILFSRLCKAPFVYSGEIHGYDTSDVALQIVNSPRAAGNPRCAYAAVPGRIDADDLPAPRPLRTLADLRGAEVSLLIGGKAHGHTYTDTEWNRLVALVEQVTRDYGVRWRVSTSRRSPASLAPRLAALAADGRIAEFVDYRTAGAGSGDRLFAADAIVVTEDSTSMLSEGLAAGRPVIGMKPEKVAVSSVNETVAAMAASGGLAVLPIATATAEQFARTLIGLRLPETRPRDVLAAIIAPVLGLTVEGTV